MPVSTITAFCSAAKYLSKLGNGFSMILSYASVMYASTTYLRLEEGEGPYDYWK